MKQVSIIVPVYQVEQYVRSCVESLFRQGFSDDAFEVIVVNDGTRDRSMEVIADLIASHQNIVVVNQENQGLSMARNNGMRHATGEYIAFVDSDDLLIDNSLASLVDIAMEQQPDLVVGDWREVKGERLEVSGEGLEVRGERLEVSGEKLEVSVKRGTELLLEDLHPRQCYVWRTLYRRAFLEEHAIEFVASLYFEDIPFTHRCYLKARQCVRIHQPFYIYRIGHDSITQLPLSVKKAKDFCRIIADLWSLAKDDSLSAVVKARLQDNAFDIFSLLTYAMMEHLHDAADQRMVLQYLKEQAPDLAFTHGGKQQLVSLLYRRAPHTYLRLKTAYHQFAKKHIY